MPYIFLEWSELLQELWTFVQITLSRVGLGPPPHCPVERKLWLLPMLKATGVKIITNLCLVLMSSFPFFMAWCFSTGVTFTFTTLYSVSSFKIICRYFVNTEVFKFTICHKLHSFFVWLIPPLHTGNHIQLQCWTESHNLKLKQVGLNFDLVVWHV